MPKPSHSSRTRGTIKKPSKRVFYIATEDSVTGAYRYFEELGECTEYNFSEKYSFKMTVIPSKDGHSSPKYVLSNIKHQISNLTRQGFKTQSDIFWVVCDVDSWDAKQIEEVIKSCDAHNINIAFSNPCSEIWILYHQEKFDNSKAFASSDDCKKEANALLIKRGCYNHLLTLQQVNFAIGHARKAHRPQSDKWPKKQGSHVYKLVENLLED